MKPSKRLGFPVPSSSANVAFPAVWSPKLFVCLLYLPSLFNAHASLYEKSLVTEGMTSIGRWSYLNRHIVPPCSIVSYILYGDVVTRYLLSQEIEEKGEHNVNAFSMSAAMGDDNKSKNAANNGPEVTQRVAELQQAVKRIEVLLPV